MRIQRAGPCCGAEACAAHGVVKDPEASTLAGVALRGGRFYFTTVKLPHFAPVFFQPAPPAFVK